MKKTFYITTTLPYVNSEPHIGFALEIVGADIIARYHAQLLGEEVVFNTGTDEHGQKIYQNALDSGKTPQEYTDYFAAKFDDLKKMLNLSYTNFIRTTNPDHKKAAQEFWRKCDEAGDIYKKMYKVKYCVGCELEKTDGELENGRCPLHPNRDLEIREEENYFFKFSKFQGALLKLYENNPDFVKPEGKQKEIKAFVEAGLQDFSISRLKEKMPWGVSVPNDSDHVMYVWFDALINYISTIGWPNDIKRYEKFWPVVQLAGKDNLRQQSAMWQAMLISAKLPNSAKILINGFINVDGQKMSKSLGNVIAPAQLVERYGIDGTRFLLTKIGMFTGGDMDVTWERLDNLYTAHLTNGLGNLCSRVAKMCEQSEFENSQQSDQLNLEYSNLMNNFSLTEALEWLIMTIQALDRFLGEKKPWQLESDQKSEVLKVAVKGILEVAFHLQPFMPQTAATILDHFSQAKIKAIQPLFPRLSK